MPNFEDILSDTSRLIGEFDRRRFNSEKKKPDCTTYADLLAEQFNYMKNDHTIREIIPGKFITSLMNKGYCRIIFEPNTTNELRTLVASLNTQIYNYLENNEHSADNYIYNNYDPKRIRVIGKENTQKPHDPKIGIQVNYDKIEQLIIPGLEQFAERAFDLNERIIQIIDAFIKIKYLEAGQLHDHISKTNSFLRFVVYPAIDLENTVGLEGKMIERHFPHKDTSLISTIWGESFKGLEGFDKQSATWNSLTVLPGEVLVMVGQPLSLITEGVFTDFGHRVVVDTESFQHSSSRLSSVIGIRPDKTIKPVSISNNPIVYKDYELQSWSDYTRIKLQQ